MNLNDIEKLFLNRQSCRNFNPDRVPDSETLKRVAELAMLAPSACNSQPWRVDVVNKQDVVKALAATTHGLGMNKFADKCTAFAVITETASVLSERAGVKLTGRDFVGYDLGLMCAHLVLAAVAAGISSCILGMFDEKKVKQILSIPDKYSVKMVVAMGYAADDDKIREKKRKSTADTCVFTLD